MDLFDRLGPRSSLDGCEKLSASTYIELLGLINSSPGVARPTFDSSEVTEFYRETQDVVVATATGSARADILQELRDGKLFQDEAVELLREYGPRIWGDERSDLIDAKKDGTALYPKDLYFRREEDYQRIVFYVRCWMAKRALRKASEAPKGGNNAGTPKKRKRISTSASAASKKVMRKSVASDDAPVAPGSARKRPARSSAIHYAEADDEEDEERSEEEEAEGGAEEGHHWREPSVASDHLTPAAAKPTHWKKQPRHSDPLDNRSRSSSSAARLSKVVKLPVGKNKLTVFEAWEGWRESEARTKRQSAVNSPTVPAHQLPPNPYSASTPPGTQNVVDVPKQYIDKTAHEREWERPEARPEQRPESRPEGRPEIRPDPYSEIRPESRTLPYPEARPESRPEQHHPESRPSSRPEQRPSESPQYHRIKTGTEEPPRHEFVNPSPSGFQAINRKPIISPPRDFPPSVPVQQQQQQQLPPEPQPPFISRSNTEQTSPNLPTQQQPPPPVSTQAHHLHHHHQTQPQQHQQPPYSSFPPTTTNTPPTTTSTTTSPTSLSSTSEANLKRRQIFSLLITLLQSPVPSKKVLTSLEPLLSSLYSSSEESHLLTLFPPNTLPKLKNAFNSWILLHERLEHFRDRTGYYGAYGDEFQSFRRRLSFSERVPVMEAMNDLGQWRLRLMNEGSWFDEGSFDGDLAGFLGGVMRIPGVGVEDLVDGFGGYNRGLLGWFW